MKPKNQIYDLTPKISPRLAVFPGDQPFAREVAMSFAHGHHLELSAMRTTLHLGAHADAPSHYRDGAESIELREVRRYLGHCQVVRVQGLRPRERILPRHVTRRIVAPRVLFDTGSFTDPERWTDEFNSLSPELIDWLAGQGVRLVGLDTPSVDPADSKDLPAHQALFANDFGVLEGLVLKDVPEGEYNLVALPLPLEGADASPVRALLLPRDYDFGTGL